MTTAGVPAEAFAPQPRFWAPQRPQGIVEVRENPSTRALEERRLELSPYLNNILTSKVAGTALGFFKTIVHYFCYWFNSTYATIYRFKASMWNEQRVPAASVLYREARISYFRDGTPLYDFLNRCHVTSREHVCYRNESHDPSSFRILFGQPEPVFSRAAGTKYLFVGYHQSADRLEIVEQREGAYRRWDVRIVQLPGGIDDTPILRATTGAEPAGVQIPRVALMARPVPPRSHGAGAAPSGAQPSLPAISDSIKKKLKDLYGINELPPLVPNAQGILIFNASGRAVQQTLTKDGIYILWAEGKDGLSNVRIKDNLPVGLVGHDGYLQLQVKNPAEDFILITDQPERGVILDTVGYLIRQPGKHDIICSQMFAGRALSAKLTNKSPIPLSEKPKNVQAALENNKTLKHQPQGSFERIMKAPIYRVASSQGQDIFYIGETRHTFIESWDIDAQCHCLKIGDEIVRFDGNRHPLVFNFRENRIILITDFTNPRPGKEKKQHFLIIEPKSADLEVYFHRGAPLCRAPKLVDAAKDDKKVEKDPPVA